MGGHVVCDDDLGLAARHRVECQRGKLLGLRAAVSQR